jgi:hypothetical protein
MLIPIDGHTVISDEGGTEEREKGLRERERERERERGTRVPSASSGSRVERNQNPK